jgi:hypothetical protein
MKRSTSFRCRTRCLASGDLIDVLIIFLPGPLVEMNVLDDEFQNALKTQEPIPDAVALVSYGRAADQLKDAWKRESRRAQGLVERGRSEAINYLKEVSFWTFSEGIFAKTFREPSSVRDFALNMPALIARGFAELIEQRGVFQEAPPRHVFQHPSKRKSKFFFSANDLLWDEVDAYFTAILVCSMAWERLRVATVLHIDTMGIYPIARAVADVAASSGGQPAPWEIDNFHSHGGMHGLYRVVQPNEVVLISASTSGSMAATLVEEGVPDLAVLTLLDVTDKERKGTIIHARSRHPLSTVNPSGSEEDAVIELSGEYFSARGKRPRPFTLTRDHRPAALGDFLSQLASETALRLNAARRNGAGPIDVISVNEVALVEAPKFRKWLADEVRLKTPASVSHVIHMPGPGGAAMAKLCAELIVGFTGKAPTVLGAESLVRDLEQASTSGVLVCAPVLGNGHVMRSLARDLREVAPEASRHFIAGVGLPQTAEAWTRLTQFLTQSGDPQRPYLFSLWKSLPLGAPPGRGAAWERASQLAQRLDLMSAPPGVPWSAEELQQSADSVAKALEEAEQGYLANSNGQPLVLTRGFVYWDPTPEVLKNCHHAGASYLAMSAALQAAREHPNPKLRFATTVHEVVVLDPENFLRYNDGVLQASLLRAALPHEVDYSGAPELSELMREFLEKIFINHARSYGEAAPEFALALATGHLRLADKDERILRERIAASIKGPSVLLGLLCWYFSRGG